MGRGATFPDEDQFTESDELDNVLSELGADPNLEIRIFRVPETGPDRKPRFCTKVAPADLDLSELASTFGPGLYRFRFAAGGRIKRSVSMGIAGPVNAGPAPAVPAEEHHREFLEKLVLTVLGKETKSNGPTSAEILEAVRLGVTLNQPPPRPGTDAVEFLKKGMELAQAAGKIPGDDQPAQGGTLFERFAPQLLDMISKGLGSPPARAGAANPPVAAVPSPAAPEAAIVTLARQWAPRLIEEAQAGRDPEAWAAYVAQLIPEKFKPAVIQLSEADPEERMTFLRGIDPNVAPYRTWIDTACETFLDCLLPPEDEPAEESSGVDGGVRSDPASRR